MITKIEKLIKAELLKCGTSIGKLSYDELNKKFCCINKNDISFPEILIK
jgi:hypothetical protein